MKTKDEQKIESIINNSEANNNKKSNNGNAVKPNDLRINLNDIQANILKGHGRDHTLCLFIEFKTIWGNPNENEKKAIEIRKWIANFAKGLSSAEQQNEWSIRRKESGYGESFDGGLVTGFYLSARGFDKIKYLRDEKDSNSPRDNSFWKGMFWEKKDAEIYDTRSISFQGDFHYDLHALIVLADNSVKDLYNKRSEIDLQLHNEGIGRILFVEKGEKLTYNNKNREHFGYRDGISNPKLFKAENKPDLEKCMKYIFDENFGSYLVFMKLEQNVKLFNEKVRRIAEINEVQPSYIGAQVIGRDSEGIPLSHLDSHGNIPSMFRKPKLKRCPFHSHIRKADSGRKGSDVKIVRRGVPYGRRKNDFSDQPSKDVGVLFMSFQKSIENQFEEIQKQFNNSDYPSMGTGIDAIMGQPKTIFDDDVKQKWRNDRSKKSDKFRFDFLNDERLNDKIEDEKGESRVLVNRKGKVINIKGGEYFYAPTIPFLKNLADGIVEVKQQLQKDSKAPAKQKRKKSHKGAAK